MAKPINGTRKAGCGKTACEGRESGGHWVQTLSSSWFLPTLHSNELCTERAWRVAFAFNIPGLFTTSWPEAIAAKRFFGTKRIGGSF